jgi:DHA1 family tetracycline resistance protein-like MFS transporter
VPRIGEYRAALIGVGSGLASMLALAFATQTWAAYVGMLLGALQGLAYPSMNAIMSKQVPPDQQGELQGGVASMMSLTTIIGPLIMTQSLGRFSDAHAWIYFPGAAFLLSAALASLALGLVLRASAPSSALPERGAAS